MADIFGDADLFTEFDRQRLASDEILIKKLDGDYRNHGISNGSCLLGGTQTVDCERRCNLHNIDVPDSGVIDSADCGDEANFVHRSKLNQLQNEVHRLSELNIFFCQCRV